MDLLQNPRYKDAPVYLFFEKYVLDVIGQLAADKKEILQDLELQSIFGTKTSDWKDVVKEVLQLSTTIDIAILESWYKKNRQFQENDLEIDAELFSKEFVDAYFEENSKVDVWTEDTLQKAKQFIQKNQELEKSSC